MTAGVRRIGLLGGTLDPFHVGHLDAADAARAALGLDEILVIPAHDPPHRPDDPHASAFHRFAMVALAVDGREGYRASDLELRRDGPSYTALTLRDLRSAGYEPSQLYFIAGADAFAEIATWFDYPAILDELLVRDVMTPAAQQRLMDGVWALDSQQAVGEFAKVLRFGLLSREPGASDLETQSDLATRGGNDHVDEVRSPDA